MRAIFLADGKVFTTGFSRMSERQLALWDPVSGPAGPRAGSGVTLRDVAPGPQPSTGGSPVAAPAQASLFARIVLTHRRVFPPWPASSPAAAETHAEAPLPGSRQPFRSALSRLDSVSWPPGP